MDIKTRFESHPVIFGGGLLITGFVSGFVVHDYIAPIHQNSQTVINCNTEGIETIVKAHNQQLEALKKDLSAMEAQATSMAHIESNQRVYRDGADRIRKDIAQETADFQAAVAALSKQCNK